MSCEAAAAAGQIRAVISAKELLYAVSHLCLPVSEEGPGHSRRMIALLVDGLRYGAGVTYPVPEAVTVDVGHR